MKKLILILFAPLYLFGQDKPSLAISLIPPELLENSNAVVRNEEIHFEVSSPGRATKTMKRTVSIFNDKSRYNYITVFYDSFNKLGKIKGKVYDAQGNLIRSLHKKEIRDVSAISGYSIYEDDRVRYINVDQSDYPYTVEFEYSITYKDILGYPGWSVSEFGVSVESAQLSIEIPTDLGLYFEASNLEVEPEVQMKNNRQQYQWSVSNIPASISEKYGPRASELLPIIRVSPDKFEIEGYTGSMSDWQSFGQFIRELSNGRDELSPTMKQKVQELIGSATSAQEKIDILYRYLQENMRYVSVQLGIGGWQPFDAKYVEENKYGDCKALSNFMMALLKEAGIKSYPTLIYAGDLRYEIHSDFAHNAFNHMILHVPEEDYWLECTSTNSPPNYLGSSTADRNVLLITEKGGVVARTPKLGPEKNVEENEVTIVLDDNGNAQIEIKSLRKGAKQEYSRYVANNLSTEELQKEYLENIPLSGVKIKQLSVKPNPNVPETNIDCEADALRFASKAGTRLFVPLNPLNPFTAVPESDTGRIHRIVRRNGYVEKDQIIISIPEGYKVESVPEEAIEIKVEHVEYSCTVNVDNQVVIINRTLSVLPCELPAEKYEDWSSEYKKIARADNAKMVLVEK